MLVFIKISDRVPTFLKAITTLFYQTSPFMSKIWTPPSFARGGGGGGGGGVGNLNPSL